MNKCTVCGIETSALGIPGKPADLCVRHWSIASKQRKENEVIDRIISDANEQPEPCYLEADGPCGCPIEGEHE